MSQTDNPYRSSDAAEPGQAAGSRVNAPAWLLLIASILWMLMYGTYIANFLFSLNHPDLDRAGRLAKVQIASYCIPPILYSLVLVTGCLSMLTRGSYVWALTTTFLAMIPLLTPCYFFGIPLGIWAFAVLKSPDVRASFRKW